MSLTRPTHQSSTPLSKQKSSNSLMSGQPNSQTSLTSEKSRRKDDSPTPSTVLDGNSGAQCSLAIPITSSFSKPSNKQGFRFSLRRMLYSSPLVAQRRARSLSGSNNFNLAPTSSGKKKTSPTMCKTYSCVFRSAINPN